jgi:hypothetical protein
MRVENTGMWVGYRENREFRARSWIPAFAGMTKWGRIRRGDDKIKLDSRFGRDDEVNGKAQEQTGFRPSPE